MSEPGSQGTADEALLLARETKDQLLGVRFAINDLSRMVTERFDRQDHVLTEHSETLAEILELVTGIAGGSNVGAPDA